MSTNPIIWVLWRENLIMSHADNKCVDQPAHLLENIISKLARSEISIFWLVSLAEQACLSMTFL